MQFQLFNRSRPKLIVISHERSGTHFLMNSIARCFGYVAAPWITFDHQPVNINFYSPRAVANFFGQFKDRHLANIVKSHHPYEFFDTVIEQILAHFHVFYICRDPRDVMVSFWKYINHWSWHEGPKLNSCSQFIRAQPAGQMMRYQYHQQDSMLHRWRSHVDGWTTLVPPHLREKVSLVRFEDLRDDFETVIAAIATTIGDDPIRLEIPSRHENVVIPSTGDIGGYRDHFDESDLQLFREVTGPTMQRLGYA